MSLLTIPAVPLILSDVSQEQWEKWFGFWSLPFTEKTDIIDAYPNLVIERPATSQVGGRPRVFFDPGVFETQVPKYVVFKFWDRVEYGTTFPKQKAKLEEVETSDNAKYFLFKALEAFQFAVLAYKYRHVIKPEMYHFGMDYEQALMDATNLDELISFYEFTR